MGSLNRVQLIGRLGRDPEVRNTASSVVANFSLATSERFKDRDGNQQEKTEWHKVVAWGKLAELARDYLTSGREVYVEGSIESREWTDKEGAKRTTVEIKARELVFLGSAKDQGSEKSQGGGRGYNDKGTSAPTSRRTPAPARQPDPDPDGFDDDIPF